VIGVGGRGSVKLLPEFSIAATSFSIFVARI